MKILAVDTTSLTATAAVIDSGKLLGEITINNKLTHSQTMMPMIDELLAKIELSINDIDGFAVSAGPGSFTGIRIGISSMSALAYTVKKPIVGIPTLNCLAMNARHANGLIVPLINARNRQVYAAAFLSKGTSTIEQLSAFMADNLCVVLKQIEEIAEDNNISSVTLLGDGVAAYNDDISEFINLSKSSIKLSDEFDSYPSAKWVGVLGEKLLEESFDRIFDKENVDNYVIEPIYLRKSQAERLMEEQK